MNRLVALVETLGARLAARPRLGLLVLAAVAILAFLPAFTSLPPVDRDEARFAQASRQMAATGDIIDIRFRDGPRYKKPIGIYWLQAGSVMLFGADREGPIWLYRLPSIAGAVAVVLLTAAAGTLAAGAEAGLVAGLLMSGAFILGVEARLAKTDAVLAATVAAAMFALFRAWIGKAGRQGWLLFWGALSAAILVKGPIGPMVVGLAVAALWLADRPRARNWIGALRPGRGILFLLALTLPWFVAITWTSGGAFWAEALGRDAIGKLQAAQESHGAPPGTYLLALWVTFFGASGALALALPAAWRVRRHHAVGFALAWAAPAWLVFELAPTKLLHYTLPLLPALAILAAVALPEALRLKSRWRWIVWALFTLIGAGIVIGAAAFSARLGGRPVMPVTAGLCGIAAGAMLLLGALRAQAPFAAAVGFWAMGVAATGSFVATAAATPGLWPSVAVLERIPPDPGCHVRPLLVAGYDEPSLTFLSRGPVRPMAVTAMEGALERDPCAIAIVEAGHLKGTTTRMREIARVNAFNLGTGRDIELVVLAPSGGAGGQLSPP